MIQPASLFTYYMVIHHMSTRTLELLAPELFVQQFVQADNKAYKGNMKAPQYLPFVKGIHEWPVDSPHKGTEMLKVFPYHDFIVWNIV